MGRRKIVICLFTILFALSALFFAKQEREEELPFSFLAVSEEGTEVIHYWQRDDGECFVFLPSYVSLEDLQIQTYQPVWFDDVKLNYGMSCEALELNRGYNISGKSNYPEYITFVQSGNIPTLYIDTASGTMDEIHKVKGNEEPGYLRLYTPDGTLTNWEQLQFIKARGNGTFYKSKKPYSLKLSQDADLLGMGAATKWILLANALDESHIKNKWALDFAAAIGLPYTPENRWVELYLNGNYAGLYLLVERNEVHPQRVNLKDGQGFLITKDYYERMVDQNLPHFLTNADVAVRIYQTSWSQDDIQAFVQSAENAILSPAGIDPKSGKKWTELIDQDSWTRKYLLEEILGGADAGFLSQYFHFEGNTPNGKLFAGPAWDYDYTMGIDRRSDSVPNMFYAHKKASSPWFHALYKKEEFYKNMTQLFQDEFYPLLKTFLDEKFPAYATQISGAARLNEIRWGGDAVAETAYALNYMNERAEFLKNVWLKGEDYVEVTIIHPNSIELFALDYAIPRGTTLPNLLIEKSWDWFISGTDAPYDITQPIYEDITLYATNQEQPNTEELSEPIVESRVNWELRIPLYSITLLASALFVADILRTKRRKVKKHERSICNKISSRTEI